MRHKKGIKEKKGINNVTIKVGKQIHLNNTVNVLTVLPK